MPAPAYFETLACTLACVLTCGLVGGAVWLPRRLRPAAKLFLSPVLGAALFTLPATLVGWSDHGFGAFPVRLVTLMIVALAAWPQRGDVRSLAGRAGLWILFGTLASLTLTDPPGPDLLPDPSPTVTAGLAT